MGFWAVFAIVMLVINTALMVWSLTQQKEEAGSKDKVFDELLFSHTKYGIPIPVVYGWARVGGLVIDQNDFRSKKETTSQGGGSLSPKVETYSWTHTIRQQVAITAGMTDSLVWYEVGTQVNTVNWDCGGTMYVDFPDSETGPIANGRLYWGREQAIDSTLDSTVWGHEGYTPAYKGITYAMYKFNLGTMTSPHVSSYIIQRYVNVLDCDTTIDGDANPAQIVYDVLYNGLYGLRYPTNMLNKTTFEAAGAVLSSEILGASIATGPNEGLDLKGAIETVCDWVDGTIREKDGLLEFKLNRYDYIEANLISITAADIAKGSMLLQRPGVFGTRNVINLTYRSRARQGETDSVTIDDIANIDATKAVRVAEFDFPIQTTRSRALAVAIRKLRQNTYPRANTEFILLNNTHINSLYVYDVFKLTYPRFDITNKPYRIMSKTYLEDKTCKIEALEDFNFTLPVMTSRDGGSVDFLQRETKTDENYIAWLGESAIKCFYFIGGKSTYTDLIGFNLSSDAGFLAKSPVFVSDNIIGKTNALEGTLGASDTQAAVDFFTESFALDSLGDTAYYQGGYTIMIWKTGADLEIMYARSAYFIDEGSVEIFPGVNYYYSSGFITGLLRGQEGTTAVEHPVGSYVAYMQSDCFLTVNPWATAGSYNVVATPVYMAAGYRWADTANSTTLVHNYQDSCNGDVPLPPA